MSSSLENIEKTRTSTQSKRIWMAIVLGTLAAFAPLSIDMYLPALPDIAKEFHTNTSLVQLSLTFFLLGLSLGQLLAGPFSDVRGRRKPLLIGLMIYFVASLLCVFSQSIWGLILLRFIQGLAGAAGIVISRAIVRDLYSGSELTKFFALLALVNGVAPVLAPIVGGQLLRIAPWQGVFMVLSMIGLVMFLIVLFGLPETLSHESRSLGGIKNTLITFQKLILNRSFMGYALSQGLVFSAMFAYISGSPFVLQNIYGVSPQMFSLIFAINGIGIIIASQITGRMAGRISEKKLFKVGIGISSIGSLTLLIMLLLNAGLYAILLPLFFVVSSVGVVSTSGFSLAMQDQGKSAGSASALLGVISLIFGGSVAPLVGLGENQALSMGIVIAICGVGSFLCYVCLVNRRQNRSRGNTISM
ncbi:DHA1 family bicyclomycin/chloramphenicol resistance-like MFS transporter [Bacillus pakistanensis]|uniref:Bcr/CflA family efflux transporter n=1 Tax=Rossellomorea pakistanensis TaxID=992288 RepID=A0ABS2NCI9_9BACI|nr:multidrug effflux MFS transporter [Bacillus pakistanensis]MBM7585567.1 DHA1 family bicyclomycin/chloramphenicol resistance-like MFS transporter [Bacillus pakistanensis]